MRITTVKTAALAIAASGMIAAAVPAVALEFGDSTGIAGPAQTAAPSEENWQHDRDRRRSRHERYDRYESDRYYGQASYDDRRYNNSRVWRGRDGRYYCRRDNGTTGLLVGAVVGGVVGNEVAGRGDRTLGTLLGAVGGALLGRTIDRSNSRCR